MDRILNSKVEKKTVYEIFWACRLCGAGGGYKMPIIQNVVDLEDSDVELKQKIRECVQIDVQPDDKMPPLICELCIDKINDFYEFLNMCQQTNKRTRQRLGLPPQSRQGTSDSGDCILGVTEPVYLNDSEDEPLSRRNTKMQKKEIEYNKKTAFKTNQPKPIPRELRAIMKSEVKGKKRVREPTPPRRVTRHRADEEEDVRSTRLQKKAQPEKKSPPEKSVPQKGILKKDVKKEDTRSNRRRSLEKEAVKSPVPVKKVKITTPSPSKEFECVVCKTTMSSGKSLNNHMRMHTPLYTSAKLACDACGVWFMNSDEVDKHHKRHKNKPYRCRRCDTDYKSYGGFTEHIRNGVCAPWPEVPDVKCDECWREFPTETARQDHRCPGVAGRVGGKCSKCNKSYALYKNLKKHESTCNYKKRGEVWIDPELMEKVKPLKIVVQKCDDLLRLRLNGEHYDVSGVDYDYGLDKNAVYPYISSYRYRLKPEHIDTMVDISKDALDFVHWDSDYSCDSEDEDFDSKPRAKKVYSLSTLALKVIFSSKFLGKMPRKRKKKPIPNDNELFNSLMHGSEAQNDIRKNISSIIDNLDKVWEDGNKDDDDVTRNECEKDDYIKEDEVDNDSVDGFNVESNKDDNETENKAQEVKDRVEDLNESTDKDQEKDHNEELNESTDKVQERDPAEELNESVDKPNNKDHEDEEIINEPNNKENEEKEREELNETNNEPSNEEHDVDKPVEDRNETVDKLYNKGQEEKETDEDQNKEQKEGRDPNESSNELGNKDHDEKEPESLNNSNSEPYSKEQDEKESVEETSETSNESYKENSEKESGEDLTVTSDETENKERDHKEPVEDLNESSNELHNKNHVNKETFGTNETNELYNNDQGEKESIEEMNKSNEEALNERSSRDDDEKCEENNVGYAIDDKVNNRSTNIKENNDDADCKTHNGISNLSDEKVEYIDEHTDTNKVIESQIPKGDEISDLIKVEDLLGDEVEKSEQKLDNNDEISELDVVHYKSGNNGLGTIEDT